MSEFPELHEAYRRPGDADTDAALRRVTSHAMARRIGAPRGLKVAAVAAGLLIAFVAGFLSGRGASRPSEPRPAPAAAATEHDAVLRAPALVAGPRS